jgi:hypothetical protein
VPQGALQRSPINIFDVSMERTDTDPNTFKAGGAGTGLYFSEIIFNNEGYMTSFCAKDSDPSVNLDLCAGTIIDNIIEVEGLDYYLNTMGKAIPVGKQQISNIESILVPLLLN